MTSTSNKYFVSGGCRSGKSAFALALSEHLASKGLFIATASACDASMQERINQHQSERGSHWQLFEVPLGKGLDFVDIIPQVIARLPSQHVILLDCLTLWVSNCMESIRAASIMQEHTNALIRQLVRIPNPVVIVSNEVGLGVVPSSSEGRLFRDFVGLANQCAAKHVDHVIFCVSGLPLLVKGTLPVTFSA